MKVFSFDWLGTGSLESALRIPVRDIAISTHRSGFAYALKLWRQDRTALTIRSDMREVGPRHEVGVLCFAMTTESSVDDQLFRLSADAMGVSGVTKLTIQADTQTQAESGIMISLDQGRDLLILAGSFPCSLAISGVPGWPANFDPEYKVEEYARLRMLPP